MVDLVCHMEEEATDGLKTSSSTVDRRRSATDKQRRVHKDSDGTIPLYVSHSRGGVVTILEPRM